MHCNNNQIHYAILWSVSSHCVKSVQIRSFFLSVFSCIRTEYGLERTPYLDTFHAVSVKSLGIIVKSSVEGLANLIALNSSCCPEILRKLFSDDFTRKRSYLIRSSSLNIYGSKSRNFCSFVFSMLRKTAQRFSNMNRERV